MSDNTPEYNPSTSFGVYRILNLVTGKVYIGSTTNRFSVRFKDHKCLLRKGKGRNPHLQGAWDKYGEVSFVFEIVEVCTDKSIVRDREQYHLDRVPEELRYNIGTVVTCPIKGRSHTPEAKQLISKKNRGKKRTEETKQRMSESKRGIPMSEATRLGLKAYRTGRPLSEATKQKLSQALKGKVKSEETRRRLSEASKGKVMSEESILRMKQSWVIRKERDKGKFKCSEEAKAKLSKAHQGGLNHPNTKLTASDVVAIRRMIKGGHRTGEIAKAFGVSPSTICDIRTKKTWGHLQEEES